MNALIPEEEITITRDSESDMTNKGIQYYAYQGIDEESIGVIYTTIIIDEDNPAYNAYVYDESTDEMVNTILFGISAVILKYGGETFFLICTYLGVNRVPSLDKTVSGIQYYAYDFLEFILYTTSIFEKGLFISPTLYEDLDDEMYPLEDLELILKVDDNEYIEPHISMCREDMKVNYNSDNNVMITNNSEFGTERIYDSTRQLLVEIPEGKTATVKLPLDNRLYFGQANKLVIDGIPTEIKDSIRWKEEDIYVCEFNIPEGTVNIIALGIPQ